MALSDLNPAPYNPRERLSPDSAEYRRLKQSILMFGNVQPIVVNVRSGTNTIVGGHPVAAGSTRSSRIAQSKR